MQDLCHETANPKPLIHRSVENSACDTTGETARRERERERLTDVVVEAGGQKQAGVWPLTDKSSALLCLGLSVVLLELGVARVSHVGRADEGNLEGGNFSFRPLSIEVLSFNVIILKFYNFTFASDSSGSLYLLFN